MPGAVAPFFPLKGLGQFGDAVSATGRVGDGGRKCFI